MRAAAFNDPESQTPPSPEMLERIVPAAEDAGFEYIPIPIVYTCREAYVVTAFLAGKTKTIKPPIAADQAICRRTSSLNAPSTAISSSNEPLCSTLPARIT